MAAKERPIYGYYPTPYVDETVSLYGDVEIVFTDSAANRATVSIGDSFEPMGMDRVVGSRPGGVTKKSISGWRDVDAIYNNTLDEWESYVEAQIHGGVSVDDIKELVIHQPPDVWGLNMDDRQSIISNFSKMAEKAGIRVSYVDTP